jgi:hypothetical protein
VTIAIAVLSDRESGVVFSTGVWWFVGQSPFLAFQGICIFLYFFKRKSGKRLYTRREMWVVVALVVLVVLALLRLATILPLHRGEASDFRAAAERKKNEDAATRSPVSTLIVLGSGVDLSPFISEEPHLPSFHLQD